VGLSRGGVGHEEKDAHISDDKRSIFADIQEAGHEQVSLC
jgi:hypothetical protein